MSLGSIFPVQDDWHSYKSWNGGPLHPLLGEGSQLPVSELKKYPLPIIASHGPASQLHEFSGGVGGTVGGTEIQPETITIATKSRIGISLYIWIIGSTAYIF